MQSSKKVSVLHQQHLAYIHNNQQISILTRAYQPQHPSELNQQLAEFILKFHAWSTSRPQVETARSADALSEEANNIENIEREQGTSSAPVSFFGMPTTPSISYLYSTFTHAGLFGPTILRDSPLTVDYRGDTPALGGLRFSPEDRYRCSRCFVILECIYSPSFAICTSYL